MTGKKLRPAALLPPLTANKNYIKKIKFIAKKKEAAAAAERGFNSSSSVGKKKKKNVAKKEKKGKSVTATTKKKGEKKVNASAKKASTVSVKGGKKAKKSRVVLGTTTVSDSAPQEQQQQQQELSPKELDRLLIERAIRGEEGAHDPLAPSAAAAAAGAGVDELLQYPCLPFLEDYAEQKRSEVVSADTLLHNAHSYFKDLGKRESAMRRAAAKRLRELKEINRRGGDKDGFRYVVPRNVKEVVRQMAQNADVADVDTTQLASTFGGDDDVEDTSERPMHRRKRQKSCFSDFYQFQVSRRWTRNAENFLNKGRAHKSMFEAARQQRSNKKF
ncbi:hypothetical protein DQ04_03391050 [Trypanosoma grayi]|uniref:hypothetical protein n=1 Tax=Trypanosoma grayi TaxID=71804 RepID=UPI0004F411D7|nr:hypothetical protein DQ04_03391050 [Trypanosoma grayi]KEG10707.1 hypothetical protein DQ04_03391050 [Trypanosoma grayi]